jgi:hypothetical protein
VNLRGAIIGENLTVAYVGDINGFVKFRFAGRRDHPFPPQVQVCRGGKLIRQVPAFNGDFGDHFELTD